MKTTCIRNFTVLAAAGVLTLVAGLTARADYPSAVLADGPLTYHRFSETVVSNDTMPVVVNLGTLGAAVNGTHVTSFRDDLIVPGVPGALGDPDNTAIGFPYSPATHTNFVKVPWQDTNPHYGWVKLLESINLVPLSKMNPHVCSTGSSG